MIRLIAFDLDGTLLDTEKGLSERAARALKEAADWGVITVPATGRLQKGLPAAVRAMEHARYGILLNGGLVKDMKTGEEKTAEETTKGGFFKENEKVRWNDSKLEEDALFVRG